MLFQIRELTNVNGDLLVIRFAMYMALSKRNASGNWEWGRSQGWHLPPVSLSEGYALKTTGPLYARELFSILSSNWSSGH